MINNLFKFDWGQHMKRTSVCLRNLSTVLSPLALILALPAMAGSSSLVGRLVDPQGHPVGKARIRLVNRVAGYVQTGQSDAQGQFSFHNIPYNAYHLEVFAQGMEELHREVELRTSLPLDLAIPLKPRGAVVAVEESLGLVEDHPSTHLDIDRSTIEHMPAAVQSRAMESILLTTPGFIADENGRFHFRGSHGQATYVIDGIPVSDQLHATFSNSLDPAQVENMEVITGGVSAEYGGKPVAVINMTTRSGLGTPGGVAGDVSIGLSRFGTREAGLGVRGCTDRFGYFVSGAASESDRFLDPVNFENLHNHGSTGRLSTRFDWILGDKDVIRASISGGRTKRQVANLASQEAAGMNQAAETTDSNVNVGWNHSFSGNLSLEAALYHRRSTSALIPTEDLQEGFSAAADTPVWVRQNRSLENWGALAALTRRFEGGSTVKAGLQYLACPIHESFRFAITDDALVSDPSDPLYAYTPGGGGHIFNFDERIKPTLSSAFVQSDLHLGSWLLALGLRYDRYTLRDDAKNQLQPRLGVSYKFQTGTVLRASYDRLLVTRENENLALATSRKAWDLGPYAGSPVPALLPELQDSYTVGVEQQLGPLGRFMFEYWAKDSENAGDNSQFLNTGILFPISAQKGTFRGCNARFDLVPVHGFSGYLSLGKTRAVFQAPVVGGLQLEAPEAAPGERFLIDHDQKLAAQVGLRYEFNGFSCQVQGRYDSGLVAGDPADAVGNADLAFGSRYVRQDSEGTWRVKSRTTWNLSAAQAISVKGNQKFTLSADLLNAFNEKGLYNFLSVFGGTHVIPPRTWAMRVKYTF
ncbi:MAG: TonB-dependent receptor [Holophagaceae bacterium]|nr:TonB-dependent receptor [Holophagaceae bacterium]